MSEDYERRKPIFARDRAIILQILCKERKKCTRERRPFCGLTYQQIRHWYSIQEGRFKDLGNRIRELRELHYIETIRGQDGYLYVKPT